MNPPEFASDDTVDRLFLDNAINNDNRQWDVVEEVGTPEYYEVNNDGTRLGKNKVSALQCANCGVSQGEYHKDWCKSDPDDH